MMNKDEDYWDNKYPKITIQYTGRFIPQVGRYAIDVRAFLGNPRCVEFDRLINEIKPLWIHTHEYLGVKKEWCDDQKALACLKWVINNIKYLSDKSQFNLIEYWMYPQESLHVRAGDCDDGAILLANLMLVLGIPQWKIRIVAGWTFDHQGHCYVTYYCEETEKWVALDWCFYPNTKKIKDRRDYKNSGIYADVWFSWTKKQAYGKLEELEKC